MANFCRNRFCPTVALRKESVDRNREIYGIAYSAVIVALRKESVDRNFNTMQIVIIVVESLSARRAWIEIVLRGRLDICGWRRSPQGERG